ncbi:unnamed protein product [Rotaria magnacalcarata]|uniref:Uncharacterized protein n=2 Tax=Rotaria magnacalcarata TaxID=392030 RepID=A0A815DMZ2_9BILA|nr:unnamed protein product [Rotaria magnacalcarata]CAF3777376.1 unnamed protein product [Rotaria magnacalcarata]CAF3802263.1 unnamed protein product [Rotaria magnacalcarata]
MIENSAQLQEKFEDFRTNRQKTILITTIDTHIDQQRAHIPYIRHLIDGTEYACNTDNIIERKYFVMLIHSPAQDLYHQSCFPAIFLHHWDFHFFDTCAAGSAFYLQKLLQLLSSSSSLKHELEIVQDNTLCDLNDVFEDCLWNFCSRIQILAPNLPKDMFTNPLAHEFYQRETNPIRRVKCLRQILQQSLELQKSLVNIYHQHLLRTKNSSKKFNDFIYQISKDILCGKRFDGLVESIQIQTRHSFINFVSTVFKILVNDYGLATVSQLSTNKQIYGAFFHLIDFQSYAIEDDKDIFASQTPQGVIQFITNYSCIPQTPLFHLFHQRIRSHANAIKLKHIRYDVESKECDEDFQDDSSVVSYNATTDRNSNDKNKTSPLTFDCFRSELISSIRSDKILADATNSVTVHSYSIDLVRTLCAIMENNFDHNPDQYQQTVKFISHWLSLIDDNDMYVHEDDSQKHVWLLAHVYTAFEYEKTDIISMYSACRIMNYLDSIQSPFAHLTANQSITRSDLRDTLFRSIFDQLWANLCQSSSNKENCQTWIHTYIFISKYYPSEKVLQGLQLVEIRCQIELMKLAYLIFLKENILQSHELVTNLLEGIQLNARSDCLRLLPKIIEIIYHFIQEKNLENLTLMIDVQQWVISICKSSTQPSEQVLRSLLTYLNQSTIHISLAMKQFLFDQLADLFLQMKQNSKLTIDLWDRFNLIPMLTECVSDIDHIEHYRIPFHPSIDAGNDREKTHIPLFDLYFFHLRGKMKHDSITPKFLNKGMLLKLSKTVNEKEPLAENLFKQLKNYFLSIVMALLIFCSDTTADAENEVLGMFTIMIQELLFLDSTVLQLSDYVQLFLSTGISKHSWQYLFNFLQSKELRAVNANWATALCRLLQLDQTISQNPHLQLSHQIQFTFSSNSNNSSIFPTLHQPYEELRKIIDTCAQNQTDENSWEPFISWINSQLHSELTEFQINQLKAMLLLNIYYDYYCTNQLEAIRPLTSIIPIILSLSREEVHVFCVLLNPERFMIGYDSHNDTNSLNDLFKLDCQNEFDLSLRHLMVNLMAMILLGGRQSFLWTLVFEPLSLENTFGFGSLYPSKIHEDGVHYDCGCIISENGDLERFYEREYDSVLNVPAAYVAYFSTFGALAWHLLLCEDSVENLHGPILAPTAIDDTTPACRQAGQSIRAKTCHFVCARLLSTFHFLSLRLNHEDSCILLSRCFERMAFLTANQQQWIQPVYTRLDDKLNAEEEFQNDVFYFVFDKLVEYKADINQRILQSQIQRNLQQFIDQMPLVLDFQHFQIALHRSNTQSTLSLKLLRFILDSFGTLKVTKLITHLARFYLLLHQTYAQLIKTDELLTMSLRNLHARAEKRFHQFYNPYDQNEKENHRTIIDNGIEAVNSYHQFSHGLIRPGACDQTQLFKTITFDTPVDYLLTMDDADVGNIIMRILSVLVDYHNHVLELLQRELNSNENYSDSVLKLLVNEMTSKEISILQVASYDIGIIALNEKDCEWIERLCQASLTSNEEQAFINVNSSFTFDFEYVQSQIIRTYLLLCRINYQPIIQKYQCYTPQSSANLTTADNENLDLDEKYLIPFTDEQLDNEWNYLKTVSLDKLYHAYTLLKQIAVTLKTYPDNMISSTSLFNYVRSTDQDNDILERMQQYEIKDFPLCHFQCVIKLYAQLINEFEHLFTDVSPLRRIPIDTHLNAELIKQLDEHIVRVNNESDMDKIQTMIQAITQLLNDLKNFKDSILQQSSQSFVETCHHLAIENPILEWIPSGIRCENYVPLNIHLVRVRSILQEQKINIEEKTIILWQEQTNELEETDENPVQPYPYMNDPSDVMESEEANNQNPPSSPYIMEENSINETDLFHASSSSPRENIVEASNVKEPLMYSSLFKLDMQLVPCSSLNFLQQLHEYRMERIEQAIVTTKAAKFTINHPEGKPTGFMCKVEKFQERLRKIFDDHHYDHDQYVLVDKNEIFVDFNKDEFHSSQISFFEYRIVERKHLICVEFQYHSSTIECLTTSTNRIATVIKHFIDANQLKDNTADTYLCFCDQYGACIEDVSVQYLHENKERKVTIIVKRMTSANDILCEIHLTNEENFHQTAFFDSEVTWQQIELWLKDLSQKNNLSADNYAFLSSQKQTILEKSQTISSTIDSIQSNTVDAISKQVITSVTLSYENNSENLQVLKSMKIIALLKNESLQRKLGIVETIFEDYTMVLDEADDHVTLSKDDMQHSFDTYCKTENESLHFRLFIPTHITIYHNEEKFSTLLPMRNITIHEVLQLIEKSMYARQCLALKETKRVLDDNEVVSNLCGNEFILVDKKDTCHVSVKSPQATTDQYFINHATIVDVCKEQQINLENQYLLYSNDIVLSAVTPLTCFLSETPICFTITETSLPVTVIVTEDQQQKSIQFNCAHSITVEDLCTISCRLLGVLEATAELKLADASDIDNDLSLMDIDETMTHIEFQLIYPPCLSCSITCSDHTIVLPCQSDRLISSLITDMFEKLSISQDQMDAYELFALNDEETSLDFDVSIGDIKELFSSSSSSIIAVELRKK